MVKVFADLAAEILAAMEEDFETQLIRLVKNFGCLYSSEHSDYYNAQQNKIAWEKIGSILNKPVSECMNKWFKLLHIFLFHYRREIECTSTNKKFTAQWQPYKLLKDLQRHIVANYSELMNSKSIIYEKPIAAQKDMLLLEMANNRSILFGTATSSEQRQRVWQEIVFKLNSMAPGVQMPVEKWQKYWWDLKQTFGQQSCSIRSTLQKMGNKTEVPQYTDDDLAIIKICRIAPTDRLALTAFLDGLVEFGDEKDKVLRKCKKCTILLGDLMVHDYCDTCRKVPKTLCDICSKRHEEVLVVYLVKNWSSNAKSLLPPILNSYAELAICTACSDDLKKQASVAWKACRICGNYSQSLDTLFCSTFDHLRKVFWDATSVMFSDRDGLPGYVCQACKVQMHQFNNFYLRFSRAQTRLFAIHAEKFIGDLPVAKPLKSAIVSKNKIMILRPEEIGSVSLSSTVDVSKSQNQTNSKILPSPATVTSGAGQQSCNLNRPTTAVKRKNPNTINAEGTSANIGEMPPKRFRNGQLEQPVASTNVAGTTNVTFKFPGSISLNQKPTLPMSASLGKGPIVNRKPVTPSNPQLSAKGIITLNPGSPPNSRVIPNLGRTSNASCSKSFGSAQSGRSITKQIQASQPAVFTLPGGVSDFGNDINAPPVYCIPKPNLATYKPMQAPAVNSSSVGKPPLQCVPGFTSPFADNVRSPTKIKTEVDSSPRQSLQTPSSSLPPNQTQPAFFNIQSTSGSAPTIAVKEVNSPQKLNSFQNAYEAKHSPKATMLRNAIPLQRPIAPTPNQQQQATAQAANKRKYWGAVDKFQLNSVPIEEKRENPIPVQESRDPVKSWTSPADVNSSRDNRSLPSSEVSNGLVVKKEQLEKEDERPANEPQSAAANDLDSLMFYPDSFELQKVSLDANMSLMMSDIITKQEVIDQNIDLDTDSFKYINPSFLASYTQDGKEQKHEPTVTNGNSKKTDADKKTPNKKNVSFNGNEEPRKKEQPTNSRENVSLVSPKIETKKVCVKLRRNEGLRRLSHRLEGRRTASPRSATPSSIVTRKSLRKSLRKRSKRSC